MIAGKFARLAALFAAAGLSNGGVTAGQRRASDAEHMRTSPMVGYCNPTATNTGKPKKKPFGTRKLSRRQRKSRTL